MSRVKVSESALEFEDGPEGRLVIPLTVRRNRAARRISLRIDVPRRGAILTLPARAGIGAGLAPDPAARFRAMLDAMRVAGEGHHAAGKERPRRRQAGMGIAQPQRLFRHEIERGADAGPLRQRQDRPAPGHVDAQRNAPRRPAAPHGKGDHEAAFRPVLEFERAFADPHRRHAARF